MSDMLESYSSAIRCASCGAAHTRDGRLLGSAWTIEDLFKRCGINETTLTVAGKMARNVGDQFAIGYASRLHAESEVNRLDAKLIAMSAESDQPMAQPREPK